MEQDEGNDKARYEGGPDRGLYRAATASKGGRKVYDLLDGCLWLSFREIQRCATEQRCPACDKKVTRLWANDSWRQQLDPRERGNPIIALYRQASAVAFQHCRALFRMHLAAENEADMRAAAEYACAAGAATVADELEARREVQP